MKEARVFIVYHPAALTTFNLLADFVHANLPGVDCVLIRALHPYWKTVDIERHLGKYDLFLPMPDAQYLPNLIAGLARARRLQREARQAVATLGERYGRLQVYSDNSAYLPVNILLSCFYRSGAAEKIYRLARTPQSSLAGEPKDTLFSLLTAAYNSLLGIFKVAAVRLPAVTSFIYTDEAPVPELRLANPLAPAGDEAAPAAATLPEPYLLPERPPVQQRDTVAVFGHAGIPQVWPQYIDDAQQYEERLRRFFARLRDFYPDCTLVYKPHPADGGKLMTGIDRAGFAIYDEPQTAEVFLAENLGRMRAAYSVVSVASVSAALMRVPAYHIFEHLVNEAGAEALNEHARDAGWYGNPYLRKLRTPEEIGSIDDLTVAAGDEGRWRQQWLDFLK